TLVKRDAGALLTSAMRTGGKSEANAKSAAPAALLVTQVILCTQRRCEGSIDARKIARPARAWPFRTAAGDCILSANQPRRKWPVCSERTTPPGGVYSLGSVAWS